jgi:hypothetical protein
MLSQYCIMVYLGLAHLIFEQPDGLQPKSAVTPKGAASACSYFRHNCTAIQNTAIAINALFLRETYCPCEL